MNNKDYCECFVFPLSGLALQSAGVNVFTSGYLRTGGKPEVKTWIPAFAG